MQRYLWVGIVVVALGVGLATGLGLQAERPGRLKPAADMQTRLTELQRQLLASTQQIRALQQQLADKEAALARLRVSALTAAVAPVNTATALSQAHTESTTTRRSVNDRTDTVLDAEAGEKPSEAPDENAALTQFYQYLDDTAGISERERRQRARALLDTLRDMGEPAVLALMQVLQDGIETRERSVAARLLGSLQDPQALPALQNVLESETDLLLRRAAARGLSRLQVPEAIPILDAVLTNAQEDRFVRMSAAYGLARQGETQGINGLEQIFTESAADGRGHYLAFRALMALNSAQSVPLMRQIVNSEAEVTYRVRAIQFLADQGDQEAVPLLQQVVGETHEQPSVRETAERALATLSTRR